MSITEMVKMGPTNMRKFHEAIAADRIARDPYAFEREIERAFRPMMIELMGKK